MGGGLPSVLPSATPGGLSPRAASAPGPHGVRRAGRSDSADRVARRPPRPAVAPPCRRSALVSPGLAWLPFALASRWVLHGPASLRLSLGWLPQPWPGSASSSPRLPSRWVPRRCPGFAGPALAQPSRWLPQPCAGFAWPGFLSLGQASFRPRPRLRPRPDARALAPTLVLLPRRSCSCPDARALAPTLSALALTAALPAALTRHPRPVACPHRSPHPRRLSVAARRERSRASALGAPAQNAGCLGRLARQPRNPSPLSPSPECLTSGPPGPASPGLARPGSARLGRRAPAANSRMGTPGSAVANTISAS